VTEILHRMHKRDAFDCGKEPLNNYLKLQARQDMKKMLSVCFVLAEENSNILGYYTLSNSSIPLHHFPEKLQQKLPSAYGSIPATLLGRLAIDNKYHRSGLGKMLLMDALKKSFENSFKIASFAVIVDPIDDEAVSFYEKYDFIQLPDSKRMMLAMNTLKGLF
jgi:ribosomal protein S18 acetylase RimI-like enzyme